MTQNTTEGLTRTTSRDPAMTGHLGKKGGSTRATRRISVKTWPTGPRKQETTDTQDGRRAQTRAAMIGNGRGQWRTPGTIRQSRSRSRSGTSISQRRGTSVTRTPQADNNPEYSVLGPAKSKSRRQRTPQPTTRSDGLNMDSSRKTGGARLEVRRRSATGLRGTGPANQGTRAKPQYSELRGGFSSQATSPPTTTVTRGKSRIRPGRQVGRSQAADHPTTTSKGGKAEQRHGLWHHKQDTWLEDPRKVRPGDVQRASERRPTGRYPETGRRPFSDTLGDRHQGSRTKNKDHEWDGQLQDLKF